MWAVNFSKTTSLMIFRIKIASIDMAPVLATVGKAGKPGSHTLANGFIGNGCRHGCVPDPLAGNDQVAGLNFLLNARVTMSATSMGLAK